MIAAEIMEFYNQTRNHTDRKNKTNIHAEIRKKNDLLVLLNIQFFFMPNARADTLSQLRKRICCYHSVKTSLRTRKQNNKLKDSLWEMAE